MTTALILGALQTAFIFVLLCDPTLCCIFCPLSLLFSDDKPLWLFLLAYLVTQVSYAYLHRSDVKIQKLYIRLTIQDNIRTP